MQYYLANINCFKVYVENYRPRLILTEALWADGQYELMVCNFDIDPLADLRGGARDARPPPGGPNSFDFMQFFRKFGNFVCWRPPLGSWRPLLGEILDPPLRPYKIINICYIIYSMICK